MTHQEEWWALQVLKALMQIFQVQQIWQYRNPRQLMQTGYSSGFSNLVLLEEAGEVGDTKFLSFSSQETTQNNDRHLATK